MTHTLILRPEAEEDLRDAYRWYDEHVPGLGLRFLASVEQTLGRIEHSPQLYAEVHEGVRRALISTFPYGVYYINEDGRSIVIAVVHSSRHPRVWMERTRPAT